jgi:hypothetical protein
LALLLGNRLWEFSFKLGGKVLKTARREIICSAAVAGAALGRDKSLVIAPRDRQTADRTTDYLGYKIEDAESIAIAWDM